MAEKRPQRRSSKLGGKSKTLLPDFTISTWEGLNTYIKDLKELSDGQSPDSLNWITGKYQDHIELRRGSALLGTTRNAGSGRVTGLGVASMQNGTQIPFFSYAQKFKYYNATTNDTVEIGTNNLPTVANGDDVSFMPYQNLAGTFMYATSPNSSIYKIHTANPGSISDLQSFAYRGIAKIDNNRMFMWQRKDIYGQVYANVLNVGVSDKATISQYTQTTKENLGTGNGSQTAFTGTLAFRAANAKATCFATEFAAPVATGVAITGLSKATQAVVTVASHTFNVGDAVILNGISGMTEMNNLFGFVEATTATTITLSINSSSFTNWSSGGNIYLAEYFIDDLNGNLSSAQGGTGTINYTTGAFTLNFHTAPINAQNIYGQYYVEDATSSGVADFTVDGSTKGKGKVFNQFDGGADIQGVFPFDQVQYCFHQLKTWYLSLGTDDTQASNLPYRSQLGMPYARGGYATDDGIIFADLSNPQQPQIKVLTIDQNSATAVVTVVPQTLSDNLDLSSFGFTKVAIVRWGDYDLVACQGSLNGVVQAQNTVMFCRNIYSGIWDKLDYSASCFAFFNGSLLAGDSLTNNVFTLFSGTDDDGANIANYWTSKMFNLGVPGMKKTYRIVVKGLIQQTQNVDIYFSFDSGTFVKLCTIQGNASYVNLGNPVDVGSSTIGSNVIGGGGLGLVAYPFEVEFTIASDNYEYIQFMLEANNIGYVSIDEFTFKDNRLKSRKVPPSRLG